jgi:hypothetical protein
MSARVRSSPLPDWPVRIGFCETATTPGKFMLENAVKSAARLKCPV